MDNNDYNREIVSSGYKIANISNILYQEVSISVHTIHIKPSLNIMKLN